MTYKEVTNNFIYHKWYDKHNETIDFYTLSPEFTDMVRWGFGKIFTPSNTEDMIIPFSSIAFYCINKDGYLKIFTKTMEHIDNLSVNFLINEIKRICEEFNLKFVALYFSFFMLDLCKKKLEMQNSFAKMLYYLNKMRINKIIQ